MQCISSSIDCSVRRCSTTDSAAYEAYMITVARQVPLSRAEATTSATTRATRYLRGGMTDAARDGAPGGQAIGVKTRPVRVDPETGLRRMTPKAGGLLVA
jgi:hypothetical protein